MSRPDRTNALSFALLWIFAFAALNSLGALLSSWVGIANSVTALFHAGLSLFLLCWIWKNGLCLRYGLCRSVVPAKTFLYYLPLCIVASMSLWGGVGLRDVRPETLFCVVSLCCAGLLEELLFRGLLFRAMEKDGLKSAIVGSSLAFGLSHIVNFYNGSGQSGLATLVQIAVASTVGLVLVLIFHRGGSLIPCILFHVGNNALSVLGEEQPADSDWNLLCEGLLVILILSWYLRCLLRAAPSGESDASR